MPPRYAYWTILIGNEPTAFRAGSQEDLLPTFKRLQLKNPDAKMMWFQNGKLWGSRLEAQEAMRERGERGRSSDPKQSGFRARKKIEWRPKDSGASRPRDLEAPGPQKLEWKAKGKFTPAPKRSESPEWKPKGSFDRDRKPEWRPKDSFDRNRKPAEVRDRRSPSPGTLEWKPKRESASGPSTRDESPRRKPAARSGSGRDKTWRPGGEHKDPRQKYKDAKKAKWTRFKKNIRTRWEAKQGKKNDK